MGPCVDLFLDFIIIGFSFLDFSGFDSKNPEVSPIDCFVQMMHWSIGACLVLLVKKVNSLDI
jgi:hypothetical protein